MIDRKNVIKGLADISEYARAKADIAGIGKGKEVFDSYYRAAEDAIALLKEQVTDGWISVKGAMPEEDGQYLVLLNKTHLMVVSFAKKLEEVDREVFAGRDEPGWFEWDTEWCGFYEVTMVTHWMPIPKLPQEVTGDE